MDDRLSRLSWLSLSHSERLRLRDNHLRSSGYNRGEKVDNKLQPMLCTQCGAPMQSRRKCDYCHTTFFIGDEPPAYRPTSLFGAENGGALLAHSTFSIDSHYATSQGTTFWVTR